MIICANCESCLSQDNSGTVVESLCPDCEAEFWADLDSVLPPQEIDDEF